jgi:hypothetical protein
MILKAGRWPEALTDVANGASYIQGAPTGTVWSYLQQLAESEQGRLFVAGDGKITFRRRTWDVTATVATTSQATLTDDLTGDIFYSGIETIPASQDTIINRVVAVREGGVPQHRQVPRAQRRATFLRSFSGLLLNGDDRVAGFAQYQLDRHSVRKTRFSQVTIYPQHARQTAATVWPFVLGVQPGWRVTVRRTQNDVGSVFSQACTVEGVEHSFTAEGVWETRLYLVPAQESATAAPWALLGTTLFNGTTDIHF